MVNTHSTSLTAVTSILFKYYLNINDIDAIHTRDFVILIIEDEIRYPK